MIATRSVERGGSALHKSSQLHSRLLYSPFALHSSRLMINNNKNNSNISISTNTNNCCRRRHNAAVGRLFQNRHAHTSVPFGWTNVRQDEEPPSPPEPQGPSERRGHPPERVRLARRPTTPGFILGPGPLLPQQDSTRPGSVSYYHAALKALLNALRLGDTFKLYLCLVSLVRGHETETGRRAFTEVVASISATTFSEILRSFDPYKVAEEIDTAPGMNISYGVAIYTPLGELVNKWGIKTLYVRILRRLLHTQLARRNAGLVPLMNDYIVLMRCAGATSSTRVAKDIWYSMTDDRRADTRHLEAYAEFIKARYLADKIYANNDLSRLRLRPLDMHRSSTKLPGRVRLRLLHLNAVITDRRKHRFGSNVHERFFDEPLTKLLRKRDPLVKLERTAALRGLHNGDEKLICALMKANGRAGRTKANSTLLKNNWGVLIKRDRTTGAIAIEGGHTFPPDSPRAPTSALLDAIVHSYCSMGEVTLAVALLDYMSQRFNIPVPDHVWSDLIEYTRVMQSKPAANEWAIARFPHKGASADQVLKVWSLCTQAPYSFRPGARDYYALVKSLVRKNKSMLRAIEALRQIKPLYDDAVDACEQAWCELVQTTQQAVPNHGAFRRYKVLQAKRNHMWFMFSYSIRLILNGARTQLIDDDCTVREIPKIVGDFAQFLPLKVSYSIATGVVEFSSDFVRGRNMVEVEQTVVKPPPTKDSWTDVQQDGDASKGNWDACDWQGHQQDDYSKAKAGFGPASPATGKNRDNRVDEALDSDEPVREYGYDSGYSITLRRVVEAQEVEKPAYLYRPRFSGPSDQSSVLSIRRDGGEFTGFHKDPLRRHFAAYRVHRTTRRVYGVPADFKWPGSWQGKHQKRHQKMVDELLRMRM
ncbi:hypothetical protein UCDDA912_g02599 [Diaporthe ampelina]|uniref:Pentatricopeptide repeat domain-containing protein n=1 Tax=Diaporthe ampelina TaxID=1214573 RepID=A0A0G2FTS7_9PEZI|nr:hypothetical protein UCDDA912_g02599 [Diaporthe ampelina]